MNPRNKRKKSKKWFLFATTTVKRELLTCVP